MTIFIGILLALFVFFVVVFLHELGHFLVARWSGVKVHEFGLGIPPRLLRLFRDKKGTEWTLNWFPLGGFVRLKGENFDDPESREKDALPQVPWWKQVAILLAGVTMNFILAGCLFGLLFYRGTEPLTVHIREFAPNSLLSQVGTGTKFFPIFQTLEEAVRADVLIQSPGVIVLGIVPESLAFQAGLKTGDVISSVNSIPVNTRQDVVNIAQNNSKLVFSVQRGGMQEIISINSHTGQIGAYLNANLSNKRYQYSMIQSLFEGMQEVYRQTLFSFRTFGAIIRVSFSDTASREQKQEAVAGIGGPVAIARVFVDLADYGLELRNVIIFTAMISLSLGVFNLLPFPALDGGRCLLVLVNRVIHVINPRFKISPRIEQIIHSLGFIVLILASILVTWKDIFFHQ